MNIARIRRGIIKKILSVRNPVKLAKLIGVNFVENGLHIYGKIDWGTEPWIITLGTNVHITEGTRFITHDGGTLLFRDKVPDLEITKPIKIGNNVYIGNDVIILPGVIIGDNVVVGAGAVVSKSIPDNSVAVGIPAKVIKNIDQYFEKIQRESLCLGNLKGKEKDRELMKYYDYKGTSKGIYF
ncbi:DapH/DapD/GlmU-related protein [[Eubacterium] hominis]|uniref:DapH/DapD/GlmU-related protein n=1 Tax=[Eubacterium] hominis TaxID=2764325 RepID=UPI003A4D98E2